MKKIAIALLIIPVIILSGCPAYDPPRKKTSVRDTSSDASTMLKNFYRAYMTSFAIDPPKVADTKLDSIRKHYCSTQLLDSIKREWANSDLDYDPFLNAQDADTSNLKSLSVFKDSDFYSVCYMDYSAKHSVCTNLKLIEENQTLKIASVWQGFR